MMRSLYSGVTGLRNHQTRMDVIGNNIANVNTVGFKSSRVVFQDIFSQTTQPASGASAANGGTNPQQIGLGTQTSTIDVVHTKAAAEYTGSALDLSIEGEGYFAVESNGSNLFTRAGNFYTDADNYLVNSNGLYVKGYLVDHDGNYIDGWDTSTSPPTAIALTGDPVETNIYIDPDYYDVTIDANGTVVGLNDSDEQVILGQLILATFSNNSGLEKVGENTYRNTINSGDPVYSRPSENGAGAINPGTLEMSNVDLTAEFTNMIVTQRGFQANSRIITTTDEMLEELVNLKR